MQSETKYSEEIAGNKKNYELPARFDITDGRYLGILQKAPNGEIDRVLLTPKQVNELLSFVRRHKQESH